MIEYIPMSPAELADLRAKANRGELGPEDTMRFVMSTRARFHTLPVKEEKAKRATKAPKGPQQNDVDFF